MDPKLFFLALLLLVEARAAPVSFRVSEEDSSPQREFDKHLEDYLDWCFEKYINPDGWQEEDGSDDANSIEDVMLSDQPVEDNPQQLQIDQLRSLYMNLSSEINLSSNNLYDDQYHRALRNRTKDTWIQILKDKIYHQIGWNGSMPRPEEVDVSTLDFSRFLPSLQIPNQTVSFDELATEKIRSYYPSCEIPRNTDQEVWKDENIMNLFFTIERSEDSGVVIATATLRLYRLPQNASAAPGPDASCENSSGGEDEKLLRVSIYWYTKSLKKHRVKKRLCDSTVVGDSAKWVELSVRPATKAWTRGKNLGLAVMVEDQDGTLLKADKYFKGPSCTIGASTPRPIPTVVVDASRRDSDEAAGSAAAAAHHHLPLPPTIDICTRQFPDNLTVPEGLPSSCELRRDEPGLPPGHHIRHQRQHQQDDPRSRVVGHKIVLTNEELMSYNAQLARNRSAANR